MTPAEQQLLAVIIPFLTPYVTAGIKALWKTTTGSLPSWLGPFKAVLAGYVVTALSRKIGVQLPTDLGQINDGMVQNILGSAVFLGAVAALGRNLVDSLKKNNFGPDTQVGKLLVMISGPHTQPATPPPPTLGG